MQERTVPLSPLPDAQVREHLDTSSHAGGATRFLGYFVYSCFFFSGAAGLIYEVVWARQLGLFLGITGFAHTAVITAYMAGLAGGSLYFGRRADAVISPLKLYAWLEIGVGLYAATTPWLFTAMQSGYADLAGVVGVGGTEGHLARFAVALVSLIIPTFLMGGTLPLLVRGVLSSLPELGSVTSRLYGLNTFGAFTGTLLAGFVLIQHLGIRGTISVGVATNLLIAVLVLGLCRHTVRRSPIAKPEDVAEPGARPDQSACQENDHPSGYGLRITILAGFATTGFAALLTQIAWIRVFVLLVGGSVYAFTIALACFLAGIALGSLSYGRIHPASRQRKVSYSLTAAAFLCLATGFTILGGIPLLDMLPEWFLRGYAAGLKNNFALFQMYLFALAFLVMILPTFFMGVLFPQIAVLWTQRIDETGRGVGTAYAVNTAGTILGALLGGLLILPGLGIEHSLILSASIYLVVGLVFWFRAAGKIPAWKRFGLPVLFLALFAVVSWLIPPWDRLLWGSGVYYRPDQASAMLGTGNLRDFLKMDGRELLYYKEGMDGTVVVARDDSQKYLKINGKTDATTKGDLPTQVLLGHMPALLHEHPVSALIIGLGSGITANAVATHESIEKITVLEILPEVIEASKFFVEENRHVLEDSRLNLVNADARNYVMSTDQSWDIIISEPSNPWVSGTSNLFTEDFFKLIRSKLAPGGIMTQWFHAYSMNTEDFRSVLFTFSQTFKYVSVWNAQVGDIVLIGSQSPHAFDMNRIGWAQTNEVIAGDLERAGVRAVWDLLRIHLLSGEQLNSYVAGAKLNSDDRPLVEFNAPRNLYAETTLENLFSIAQHINGQPAILPVTGMVRVRGKTLDAVALDLDIQFPNPENVPGMQAQWLIWREPLVRDNLASFSVGSSRQLEWHDGEAIRQLQATWLELPPDINSYEPLLHAALALPAVRSGELEMNGSHTGKWMLAAQAKEIEIGIVWSCPHPWEGFTRYIAYSRLPDRGESYWDEELATLAKQFYCK